MHMAQQCDRFAFRHVEWTEENDWRQICLDYHWAVFIFHMVFNG